MQHIVTGILDSKQNVNWNINIHTTSGRLYLVRKTQSLYITREKEKCPQK